jgi:hypothetical protein
MPSPKKVMQAMEYFEMGLDLLKEDYGMTGKGDVESAEAGMDEEGAIEEKPMNGGMRPRGRRGAAMMKGKKVSEEY